MSVIPIHELIDIWQDLNWSSNCQYKESAGIL